MDGFWLFVFVLLVLGTVALASQTVAVVIASTIFMLLVWKGVLRWSTSTRVRD